MQSFFQDRKSVRAASGWLLLIGLALMRFSQSWHTLTKLLSEVVAKTITLSRNDLDVAAAHKFRIVRSENNARPSIYTQTAAVANSLASGHRRSTRRDSASPKRGHRGFGNSQLDSRPLPFDDLCRLFLLTLLLRYMDIDVHCR